MPTKIYRTRRKQKPNFNFYDIVCTVDLILMKTFSKGDTTIWSHKLYEITKFVKDTIPSYRVHDLPELYNQVLLKKTVVSMKENRNTMKALNLN